MVRFGVGVVFRFVGLASFWFCRFGLRRFDVVGVVVLFCFILVVSGLRVAEADTGSLKPVEE